MTDPAATRDRNELLVLDTDTCWQRLAAAPIARLAFISRGEPHVRPVNHLVDGEVVFVVTRPGAKLDAVLARPGAAASLEVDEVDPSTRSGWSVIVRGKLHPVMNEVEQTRLDRLGAPAMIDVWRERRWLRLEPYAITGREI